MNVHVPLRWIRRHGAVLALSGAIAVGGGLSGPWLNRLELRFAGWVQETRGVRPVQVVRQPSSCRGVQKAGLRRLKVTALKRHGGARTT